MDILSLLAIALGLSMDSFSVSIASGITLKKLSFRKIIFLAALMGLFQALMPIVGYYLGIQFKGLIENWDHWIAFVLLSLIGGKMIYEQYAPNKEEETKSSSDNYRLSAVLILGIATSIDALAVGLSLAMLISSIWMSVLLIGSITFLVCLLGGWIGYKCGNRFHLPIEALGGVILIIIGSKILIEHLCIS